MFAGLNLKLMGLAITGLVVVSLILALAMERRALRKCQERNGALVQQIESITSARDEQRKTSERTVERVVKGDPVVIRQAERVERSELPGNCRTPEPVMGADL